jgi:Transcriptional regulator containing an amidase domain and an AraC-type DNA-binding HTH domain
MKTTKTPTKQRINDNPFYFYKNFKKNTNLTFTEYLSHIHIETIKKLLLNPYKQMNKTTYETNFQSLSQFNHIFHHITNQSPNIYHDQLHTPLHTDHQTQTHAT